MRFVIWFGVVIIKCGECWFRGDEGTVRTVGIGSGGVLGVLFSFYRGNIRV